MTQTQLCRQLWQIEQFGPDIRAQAFNAITISTVFHRKQSFKADSTSVVIDPGHGGDDPGTPKIKGKLNEADVTLKVGSYVQQKLKELIADKKIGITMTRTTDINPGGKGQLPSLNARVEIANNVNADIFVAIHVDSGGNETADRLTVHTKIGPNDAAKNLAQNIQTELQKVAVTKQGVKVQESSFHVVREQKSNVAGVLVEIGFMTNPAQETQFQSESYLQSIGSAIAQAIFQSLTEGAAQSESQPSLLKPMQQSGQMFDFFNFLKKQ